jgi:hypothetical protein
MTDPITQAGPDMARAVNAAAEHFTEGTYVVTVDSTGIVNVIIPWMGSTIELERAAAVNVRGLLQAIRTGAIR